MRSFVSTGGGTDAEPRCKATDERIPGRFGCARRFGEDHPASAALVRSLEAVDELGCHADEVAVSPSSTGALRAL